MYSSSFIRKVIIDSFSDSEVEALCFDFFPEVSHEFSRGMGKTEKIQILLDYCQRKDYLYKLVEAIKLTRDNAFDRHFDRDGVVGAKISRYINKVDCGRIDHVYQLRNDLISKIEVFQHSISSVSRFERIYGELVDNAMEHGCKDQNNSIRIECEILSHFITLDVINPKGVKFDLETTLTRQQIALTEDPASSRGRGLLMVSEIADELDSIEDSEGVRATFYYPDVIFENREFQEFRILKIVQGLENPSIRRRIYAFARKSLNKSLILDLHEHTQRSRPATKVISTSLGIERMFMLANKGFSVLVSPSPHEAIIDILGFLPAGIMNFTLEDALSKIHAYEMKDMVIARYPEYVQFDHSRNSVDVTEDSGFVFPVMPIPVMPITEDEILRDEDDLANNSAIAETQEFSIPKLTWRHRLIQKTADFLKINVAFWP